MGLIPTTPGEIGGQAVGTALTVATGIPFLGTAFSLLASSIFGSKKKPMFGNPNNWDAEKLPDITTVAQAQVKRKELLSGDLVNGRHQFVVKKKDGFYLETWKQAPAPAPGVAPGAARQARQAKQLQKQQAKAQKQAQRHGGRVPVVDTHRSSFAAPIGTQHLNPDNVY